MKKFKQNYQIQVQFRLVRNIKSNRNPSKSYKSAGFISKSMFISESLPDFFQPDFFVGCEERKLLKL